MYAVIRCKYVITWSVGFTMIVRINLFRTPKVFDNFAMTAMGVHMHPFINTTAVLRRGSVRVTKMTSFVTKLFFAMHKLKNKLNLPEWQPRSYS